MPDRDDAVVLTLSDFNDRWNKMALGISDNDVPSRPRDERDHAESSSSSRGKHEQADVDRRGPRD
jgi:hypothetical protein